MSENPAEARDGQAASVQQLLARAAASEVRVHRGLSVAIDDFFLSEDARLDERTRSGLSALLRALVETVEGEVREHAVRLLHARGEGGLVAALSTPQESVLTRLWDSGLLRDPEMMAELVSRVRQELLGAALPMHAPDDPERPSLINRFVQHPDRVVAEGAMAVLIASSRRRGSPDVGQFTRTDLPAELHHRLVWWVAAALRERVGDSGEPLDRALSEAALRSLAAYDEGDRLEATAMRFAAAIDAQAQEIPDLLVESLSDRRIVLFIALLGHALGISFTLARDVVLDPCADRMWLALRALELGREPIAQIGYALCEADPRRDLEAFADTLDVVTSITPQEAREALGPLRLHPDYRAAVIALERANCAG